MKFPVRPSIAEDASWDAPQARFSALAAIDGVVRVVFGAARVTLLALLITIEPIVALACTVITTAGLALALFYRAVLPQRPEAFWLLLALAVGSAVGLFAYRVVIGWLSR